MIRLGLRNPRKKERKNPQPSSYCLLFDVTIHNLRLTWFPHARRKTVLARVPGLPIRDYAVSSNNLVQRRSKLSAIDVTAKTMFERLYLVPGRTPIYAPSQLSLCTHTPTTHSPAISRFPCNFFRKWPIICLVSMIRQVIWPSPGTLVQVLLLTSGFIRDY